MYYVYILQSAKDKRKYIGQTEDLDRRLKQHNEGTGPGRYTKNRGPWKLIYYEPYETRMEAMKREKYLKTGVGREIIKELLKEK